MLLVGLVLGIPFSIAEVWVRLSQANVHLMASTGRTTQDHSMAEWANLDAFSAYRAKSGDYRYHGLGKAIEKTVNSDGFISTPEITTSKAPGTLRIAFLGGSSTAGTGFLLGDRQTWPYLVVEALAARFPDRQFDFLNGALGGYTSFESYGRLWSRIRFFRPDIVVVYHGWNEMYYFQRVDDLYKWRVKGDGSWSFQRQVKATHEAWLVDYVLRFSQLASRVRLQFGAFDPSLQGERPGAGPRPDSDEAKNGTYDRRALEVWRENLRLIDQTSNLIGAKLFVAKQATLMTPDLPEPDRRRCRIDFHGFGYDEHVRAFEDIYRVIDEEFAADSVIDVTPRSGQPEYFRDHIHPTVVGAEAIAETVASALETYLESKEPR